MKKLLCLILALTLALSLGVTVSAANSTKNVTLYYREIKIVIDGRTINPTDATGKAVEPFIYDGTTYLPVRAMGNALGLEVAWEDATSTVSLGTPDGYLVSRETYTYTYEYDGIRETVRYSTAYRYDTQGQVIEESAYAEDELLNVATYTYDRLGQLLSVTATDGSFTRYEYSADGSTMTEISGYDDEVWWTSVYSYSVDPATGRVTVTSSTSYDEGSTDTDVTVYDADGNMLSSETVGDDGSVYRVECSYDAYGNFLSDRYSNDEDVFYSVQYTNNYDSKGLLTAQKSVDSDGGTVLTRYSYDSSGNLVKAVEDNGGYVTTTTYTYRLGLLVEIRAEGDGYIDVTEYEYVPFCYGD